MDKLAINLKSAKLCGHVTETSKGKVRVSIPETIADRTRFCGKLGHYHRVFDIFTSPADREATVIALVSHPHRIILFRDVDYYRAFKMEHDGHGWILGKQIAFAESYPDIIAAAVEACDDT